ncbi:hypothetical protein [Pseudidiomarina sp. CB1]|uniref:hypothetical protein n=1 Tax=Pseudidiomarina sp. CB1 TaxID=2972484 RepID=UPI0021611E06|nr:hypothetical protein [Pseudidiomarina sp. CB1]
MTAVWAINGWRQQERSASAITKALAVARERGMQTYNISRIGKRYWLVCSREVTPMYDLAATVRRHYRNVVQGIYLAVWREQFVVVVWKNALLQHCVACTANETGLAHIQLLLERLTGKTRRHSALLLASSVPQHLHDYCLAHLAQWQLHTNQVDIGDLPHDKRTKLRDIALPTTWQQRQRLFIAVLLTLTVAAALGWYLWPEQPVQVNEQVKVQQALPDPKGVVPTVLQELPNLFHGMNHLAGWQWHSAELRGQELHVSLRATYGRPEELPHQLDAAWQVLPQRQQAAAKYAWPTVPFARQKAGFSVTGLDTADWQRRLKRYFPTLEVKQGQALATAQYRQSVFVLKFLQTDFAELARLSQLLNHPHLRIVKMNLQAGPRLRSELEVHLYAPQVISMEGAS